jgi:hypothetical protein
MLWLLIITVFLFRWSLGSCKHKNDTYFPNPRGHWVNKGTEYDEQWEWWEPKTNKMTLYVTVVEDTGNYSIKITEKHPNEGVEYVGCNDKREAEIAVSLFHAYYNVLGRVFIVDVVGLDLSEDMNGG